MRPSNSLVVNGVSSSASFNSGAVWADNIVRCSVQMVVSSGSAVGVLQLQGSNDQATGLPANQFAPTNWNNIGTASVTGSTSALSRSFLIVSTETSYEYLRVIWTEGSGGVANGTMSVRFKAMAL